ADLGLPLGLKPAVPRRIKIRTKAWQGFAPRHRTVSWRSQPSALRHRQLAGSSILIRSCSPAKRCVTRAPKAGPGPVVKDYPFPWSRVPGDHIVSTPRIVNQKHAEDIFLTREK